MNIVFYDLMFLVLFCVFVGLFLYSKRKNLGKESMLGLPVYLYRTKLGMKAIGYIGEKFKKTLHFVKYISITFGYLMMAAMLYLLGKSVYIYISFPEITKLVKAPPIAPLIPYFPQLFGVQSMFPPFYFTYFLIALVVVAVVHEFAHGVYMKLYGMKIKATGFAFFGPFLGAFVEEDKGQMAKKSNIAQMSVLSAGVFSNLIFALIFFGLLVGFFFLCFSSAGYVFNSYSYSVIPTINITGFGNLSSNLTEVYTTNGTYYLDSQLKTQLQNNFSLLVAYDDAPAIKIGLIGAITEINGSKIKSQSDLQKFMATTKPGENIIIKTIINNGIKEYNITLSENPRNNSLGFLGIGSSTQTKSGLISEFVYIFTSFKDPNVYYQTKYDGQLVVFIYDLLWWIMLINFLVALFNMMPLGALDGGRFFYLGIFSLTKSKKFAEKSFKYISILIGLMFLAMMIFWIFSVF